MEYTFEEAQVDFLRKSFNNIGIDLTDKQVNQFLKYYEMLVETNKVVNLTRIVEFKDVVIKHFVDSCLILKEENDIFNKKAVSVIDVGTGGGFPGIPLKILCPNIKLVLLDSLNKRINFLKNVVECLELENVECIHGRAEEAARNSNLRESFDYSVSRAVANLATLSEYCTPFVKKGGCFISYKAGNSEEEIDSSKNAIKTLNCKIAKIVEIKLEDYDSQNGNTEEVIRKFVFIKKNNNTPKAYPRKAGTPSKNPL